MAATVAKTLEGKVALVTGASSGIGRAAAIELARRGARVVASARRGVEIDALVGEISGEGLQATAVRADINVEADVERLVAETIKAYGRLDIAFNNAGHTTSLIRRAPETPARARGAGSFVYPWSSVSGGV